MRNLKRALSLALAAAMLISLMVVGASAAEYKDQDQVSKTEAVQLLSDLGIVTGDQNGNFNPTATLTRAEFTVMMSNLLNGSKFDTTLFDGTDTPFTDVQGHWAAPYIAYCYSAGVIAGTSATTFSPDSTLTAAQAAAILLMALGYNQNNEFAANNQFALNVTAIAQKEGLYQDLSVSANAGVSRENVAQMLKNALFMQTQEYLSVLEIYQNDGNMANALFNGLYRTTGTLSSVSGGNAVTGALTVDAATVETGMTTSTAAVATADKVAGNSAAIGSTVVVYKDKDGIVSTNAVVTSEGVLATVTNGSKLADLITKGNSKYIGYEMDSSVTIYKNAAAENGGTAYTTLAALQALTTYNKVGNEIVFVDTDKDNKYDIIRVTEYTLSKVEQTTAEKADGTEATVTITGVRYNNSTLSAGTATAIPESAVDGNFDALAKGDYVMYAIMGTGSGNEISVYEPTTFTGKMTKYNATTHAMVIGGTTYTASASANNLSYAQAQSFVGTGESTFYVDANGYIVAVDGINDIKYAVIDSIAWVGGSGVDAEGYAEARLIFTDGTSEIVTVDKIDGDTCVGTTPGANEVQIQASASSNDPTYKNNIYTYNTNSDGEYELTEEGSVSKTDGTITKGVPTVLSQVADNDTVYVVKTKDGSKNVWTVYTGYRNMPTVNTASPIDVAKNSDGDVVFVYVDASATTVGEATYDVVFFFDTTYTKDNTDPNKPLYEYTAILNGELTTVVATTELKLNGYDLSNNTLYRVTLNDDGQVTGVSGRATDAKYDRVTANGNASNNGVLAIDSATLVNGTTTTSLTFNGSESVYMVNVDDKTVTTGSLADVRDDAVMFVKMVGTDASDKAADKIAVSIAYVLVTD